MPRPVVRRLVWGIGAIVLVAAILLAAVPYIASTQIVRDRIAQELTEWSGYRVTLGAETSLDVWPIMTAHLTDVAFHDFSGGGDPVARVEQIDAGLAAFSALSGDIVFTQLRLVRPSLTVAADSLPPAPQRRTARGRFAEALMVAQRLIEANPTAPDVSRLPSDAMPGIEVVEGKLNVRRAGAESELLSSISGTVQWPAFNRGGSASLSGIWRGELVNVEVSSQQPMMLLAGAAAPTAITFKSSPLNLTYEGTANLGREGFVQGKGTLTSPSLRRMLEWSGNEISPGAAVGAVSLQASVSGSVRRLNLSEATVTLDGNPSRGTLEVALGGAVPAITGTLAFDTINLQSFLSAFSALTPDRWGRYSTMDGRVSEQMGLDLRLSANTATAGSLSFTDVAATAQIKGGLAAFDISDARGFGGTVQAGFRIDHPGAADRVEVRLRGVGIDLGALAKTMQVSHLMPIARGDLMLSLKGDGNDWPSIIRTAQGNFSLNLGPGSMAGVDLPTFAERASQGDFFSLNDIAGGSVSFNRLSVKAKILNGTARLEKAEVETVDRLVTLSGLVPLPGRGLALSGTIAAKASGEAQDPNRMLFFIGGSWDTPFVSPVVPPSLE
ncbi:MAG: AsmA family protein [Rhizobiaceae bacterium]|nr:AsmA family protein [Rhizobiaceae bacterium]